MAGAIKAVKGQAVALHLQVHPVSLGALGAQLPLKRAVVCSGTASAIVGAEVAGGVACHGTTRQTGHIRCGCIVRACVAEELGKRLTICQ